MEFALLIILVILLIVIIYSSVNSSKPLNKDTFDTSNILNKPNINKCDLPPSYIYSTTDINPYITGNLYNEAHPERKYVYTGRSAYGYGLQEYGDDIDVDDSYNSSDLNEETEPNPYSKHFNDGIPESWAMPSTPVREYIPSDKRDDYYNSKYGILPSTDKIYQPYIPDHALLEGETNDE